MFSFTCMYVNESVDDNDKAKFDRFVHIINAN